MKKWLLNIILKPRDRLWFYIRQQYPNETLENSEYDLRIRFGGFTFFLPFLFGIIVNFIFDQIFSIKNINRYNWLLLPVAVLYFIVWWYFNKYIVSLLSIYPVDTKHDLGKVKNILFVAGTWLSMFFLTLGLFILLK